MFCTQCGRQFGETDNFCAGCGAPRSSATSPPPEETDPGIDWRASTDPRLIMNHPEVRARVEKVTGANPQGMTAERFYELARPVMMITGAGPAPPLKLLKDVALPLYAKFGVKSHTELSQGFRNSFGETLAAVFCSLASRSQPVEDIADATDGCVVTSKMASSIWSWEGKMVVTLEARPEGTLLKAAITVPGQTSDWGKAKRVLQDLIDDVGKYRDTPATG
jgi:hypothetical protein